MYKPSVLFVGYMQTVQHELLLKALMKLFINSPTLYFVCKKHKSQEKLTLLHANNKGADQPAHVHSLLSTFVICSLESVMF